MDSGIGYVPDKLMDLTEEQRQILFGWIDRRLTKTRNICYTRTAYGLKHLFKSETGIYITTCGFRDAMVRKGFKAKRVSKENYCFNVSKNLRKEDKKC